MTERFISPCPPPTPYEDEVLKVLAEECLEASHRALKMSRFGVDEVQPGQARSNKERLELELGDVAALVQVAEDAGLVSKDAIRARIPRKLEKLARYFQNEPPVSA